MPARASPDSTVHGRSAKTVNGADGDEMTAQGIRVVLADDHQLVREGLARILRENGCEIVGEAGDGREAVRLAVEAAPRVAILDVGMPVLNGIDATRQIVRRAAGVNVLILSMHSEDVYVVQALQAGAKGYMLKDSAHGELIHALHSVSTGGAFLSPAVTSVVLDGYLRRLLESGAVDRYDALSEREREVFQLVAEGRSNKDMADILCVSVSTIETHRAHVMTKLDLHSTAEMVRYAVRRGVVS
jgi:two-component system, NarL family, response regulator NreC